MSSKSPYVVVGQNASPYSVKLRAVMRYRRLPFQWVLRTQRNAAEFAHVRPGLMPMIQFPAETRWRVDSTPIIQELEERHPEQRPVFPRAGTHRFLSHLIEDFADEWLTKAMFSYRWSYPADIAYASLWMADDCFPAQKGEAREQEAQKFAKRQIDRMTLVGCTPQNRPIIETTFTRTLQALETHVGLHDYLFGSRPSNADFALFGQLKTLATDPTPLAVMREFAQRTESWVRSLDDASGLEGEWYGSENSLPAATTGLLELAGATYLPFLVANAAALERHQEWFEIELLGQPYAQAPFRYQLKCLIQLREHFADLTPSDQQRLRPLLEASGCLSFLDTE